MKMEIWFSGNLLRRINIVKEKKESVADFIRRACEKKVIKLEREMIENGKRTTF